LITTDEITFNHDHSAVSQNRFFVSPAAEAFPTDEIEKATIDDLRETRPQTDMFVIAPEQFLPLLEEYELHREENRILPLQRFRWNR